MKNRIVSKVVGISVVLLMMTVVSCDQGFEAMNQNPNASEEVIPEYMFSSAQLSTARTDLYFLIQAMQQHATHNLGDATSAGDRYQHNWQAGPFNGVFTNEALKIRQVINAVAGSPEDVNLHSIARIWRAFIFHRLTDLYGDIPYSEAGMGSENFTPAYDSQESIYLDLLNELEQAAAALNPSLSSFGTADLVYAGNVGHWERFAYSLMLRLGMRLSEIDENRAQAWVEKAIAGGIITENAENAMIMYGDGSQIRERNPRAHMHIQGNYGTPQGVANRLGGKLSKTIIDHLQGTDDPRLPVYSVVRVRQPDGSFQPDNDPAIQMGMPNGTWTEQPPDFEDMSEPNPAIFMDYATPMLFFTAGEGNLLLAEAALRGWYAGDTAVEAYNRAVREAMEQWQLFDSEAGYIDPADVDVYLVNNPYPVGGTFNEQLDAISTQKWVSLFFVDEYEIFANWRRTGYPGLVPTNYPGNFTGGRIPRRYVVPNSEETLNNANWRQAVDRQGGDSWNDLLGRVWWDTELSWEVEL